MAKRLTQQDIARMAGVSQATVSLVLNNRQDAGVRIAPETRARVLEVIRKTGYVANPIARRLHDHRNRILGVFTYEAVFPSTRADFYQPFLEGIEEQAEEAGCDLLLFTSAKAAGGRRRIFSDDSRIRLADGCVLLGRSLDRDDLAQLLTEGIPFVSIGRRDDAGGPVPHVGADYPAAVRDLVDRAVALGHRRFAYVGAGTGAESSADRLRGFREAVAAHGVEGTHVPFAGLGQLLDAGITAVLAEEVSDGAALVLAARERGLSVPGDLSVLALGAATRPAPRDVDLTGFTIPRREMGRRAVQALTEVLEKGTTPQELLACRFVEGSTLG
ncbi:LacI family transcriptional regulator [Lentzea atacamensis]|uniref:LacI family transcriptional regulator n=1 Tax=Lentzea atacamensis TaxID=531938 RepID=A0A316I9D7_9PSEU|nr:LacI family DNA-binding transcriptional regulator [Lentzea atacamensis]PWK87012.1 LacI family transcriptional regulator [Lentzea atacamensis]RAS70279.1 LacI family transcriptional regulator [Lentzea atacamensis]